MKTLNVDIPSLNPVVEIAHELIVEIETFLETKYFITGEYPRISEVVERFGITPASFRKALPTINDILAKRDLVYFDPDKQRRDNFEIDPVFAMAVNLLVDTSDKRSKAIKLKTFGKTNRWFESMLEEPAHREYWQKRVDSVFNHVADQAKLSLSKNVELGDLPSIKYFHEFTGIHDPQREVNLNVTKLIALFMEILIKYVDPKVIDAVSREFDIKVLELG